MRTFMVVKTLQLTTTVDAYDEEDARRQAEDIDDATMHVHLCNYDVMEETDDLG